MIVRTRKDKDNPYVIIRKTVMDDVRLSLKAKGLMAYLLSKPDNWRAHVNEIAHNNADGVGAIRSAIAELIDAGYMGREHIRDDKGRIVRWELITYETPELNPDTKNRNVDDFPDTDFPDVDNQDLENHTVISNNNKITTEKETNKKPPQPVSAIAVPSAKSDDSSIGGFGEIVLAYEHAFALMLSPMQAEMLADLADEYGNTELLEAIAIAAAQRNPKLNYISGICRRRRNGDEKPATHHGKPVPVAADHEELASAWDSFLQNPSTILGNGT